MDVNPELDPDRFDVHTFGATAAAESFLGRSGTPTG